MRRHRPTPSKADLIARLHRGLRPKLARDQITDIGLVHVINLDTIARGEGTGLMMWDWTESVLTWSRVAQLLERGVPEMCLQLELVERLLTRFGRTGRVGFSGPDYQLAKTGLEVMDQLAREVDTATAISAVEWSTARVAEMAVAVDRIGQQEAQAAQQERLAA